MDQLSGEFSAECSNSSNPQVWVFGYGSLCWHPGFEFDESVTGYIKGYTRKFWQGNTTHRGTLEKPGRVATLVDEKEGTVWGRAFKVGGKLALSYLNDRECTLGGYSTLHLDFYPMSSPSHPTSRTEPFKALVFIATPSNELWLGDASLNDIAEQVVGSKGTSGYNVEYVLRLAHFMHDHIPEAKDNHLFTLEYLIMNKIESQNLCLSLLMGSKPGTSDTSLPPQQTSYQFSSRVPSKKLRCLNI